MSDKELSEASRQGRSLRQYVAVLADVLSWRGAIAVALMILVGLTEGLGLLMLIPLLAAAGLDVDEGAMGRLASLISNLFALFGLRPTLLAVLSVYILIVVVQALLARRLNMLTYSLIYEFVGVLRERLYRAVAGSNWLFFSRSRASDFTHALTSELDRVATATYSLLSLTAAAVVTAIYIILAFRLSAALTAIVFACGAGLLFLLRSKIREARAAGEQISEAYEDLYSASIEHLGGMKTVKSYGAEARNADLFSQLARRVTATLTGASRHHGDAAFWLSVGSVLTLSITVYFSIEVLSLPVATIFLLLFLFARIMPRFSSIQQYYHHLINDLPAFDSFARMEARSLAAVETLPEDTQETGFESEVRLDRVAFAYEESNIVISELDLSIPARLTTAIVGPSGAGKSTVADLILGLVTPASGRILIDGAPLTPGCLRGWREHIGYVAQETFLFHDTVRANLLWACPGASDEQIWEALRLAAADTFVSALPGGIETVVGDRGVRLSGGERQRIALARALLRKPSLLILDEATSALDSENENRIKRAIEELHGSITILIITHRLFSIARADKIYLIEQGRVVESGCWEALVSNRSSRFRAMFEAQSITFDSTAGQVSEQSV
jgi:ATP-binding cassette subfamily C protein